MSVPRTLLASLLFMPIVFGAAVCAAMAILSHFGRVSLTADIATHFAPLWLAGGLFALAVTVVATGAIRRALLVFGAVASLAAGSLIAPEMVRPTGETAPADAPGRLKLVQANVYWNSDNFDQTLAWIEAQDPDVVVLQETTPALRRMIAASGRWRVTNGGREVMILSKRAPSPVPPPSMDGPAPLAVAQFSGPGGRFAVVGAHYTWPTDPATQQTQEARVSRVLDALPGDRNILAGDLNSTPWSFSRRRWDKRFGLIRRDRAIFTWPALQVREAPWLAALPLLPLDHVYAGPGWRTVSVARGPRVGSDHYPLVVILAPR